MLRDKMALVTGGSRGIGRTIFKALCQAGVAVGFTYVKHHQAAQQLGNELDPTGNRVRAYAADITDFEACSRVAGRIDKELGGISILSNNVDITADGALDLIRPESWHEIIETNLKGVFNMTKAVIVEMMKLREGCIVNMSSVSVVYGNAHQTNYSASKAGGSGFSLALDRKVSSYNALENVVDPGFIETDMLATLKPKDREKITKQVGSSRFGIPDEFAQPVLFLCFSNAS